MAFPCIYTHFVKVLVQKKMKHRISSVILVTQYPEIKKNAEALGARVVWNPHPEEGISSSMKLGLLEVIKEKPQAQSFSACRENNACLFLVADQPWIRCHTIEALIRMYTESEKGMTAAAKNGQPGNPCIFSGKYYPELLALTGDTGGKRVMRKYMQDVALLEVPDKKSLRIWISLRIFHKAINMENQNHKAGFLFPLCSFCSDITVRSMVCFAQPPIRLEMGSAQNTPSTPRFPIPGNRTVRGTTISTFRKIEKKVAFWLFQEPQRYTGR